jgi:acyl carrier protein
VTDTELRDLLLDVLSEIAPEADAADLDPTADLRDELDLDSMDMLNVATGLEERLGISVPEADYPRLRTLEDAVAYLRAHQPATPT